MPMNNSRIPDATLARWVADNPISISQTGNIRTCPVRLGYINLFKPGKAQTGDDGQERKGNFNATIYLPPGCEHGIESVMMPALIKHFAATFSGENMRHPENPFAAQGFTPEWIKAIYRALGGLPSGQRHMPFRDQVIKQQYGGTPGLPFITAGSQNKPQVVDTMMNPIVDENRAYPGVWAILSLNVYDFGKSPPRPVRGVQFGLQSVMIIGDDEKLGAQAAPAAADFAGVKVDQTFDPAGQFGNTVQAPPPRPPAASVLPPATTVYAAPPPAVWSPPPPAVKPPTVYQPAPTMPVLPVGLSLEDML